MDDRGNTRRPLGLGLGLALAALVAAQWLAMRGSAAFDPAGLGLNPEQIEAFGRAETYNRTREWAGLFHWWAGMVAVGMAVATGWAVTVERRVARSAWRWPARVAFWGGYLLWMRAVGAPFAWMAFRQDQAYGITPLDTAEWLRLGLLASLVPVALFMARQFLVYCCMPIWRRHWWWGAPLVLFLVFLVAPEVLSRAQPMDPVETLAPLEDPELREALDGVSQSVGMSMAYFVVDQSKRSRRMNMYVTGRMGREYVVLTDTLAAGLSPREAAAVMAHEVLHQHRRTATMLRGKAIALGTAVLVFWLVHRREGARDIAAHRRLQVLLWLILTASVLGLATRPLGHWLNRTEERAADAYALQITGDPEALASAMLKVAQANLTPYDVPWWAYLMGASHPTVRERLAAINQWEPRPAATPEPETIP